MRIGFVFTNYNNSSYTRAAIASLHAGGGWSEVCVTVVDNKSRDDDIRSLKDMVREFPGVELVLNAANVGYFPGLNAGIRHLRAKWPDVEHLVVGNNDLVFPGDFLETVQRHRDVFDTWAVVAPDLVTPEGVHQNPHVLYPIGRTRRLIWDLYFMSYGAAVLIGHAARLTKRFTVREERAPDGDLYKTPGPILMGIGACYLLGPMFLKHFSRLWAPTFMMYEEFFLKEQLKAIGQMTYYDPRFVVIHHDHATTDGLPGRRYWTLSRDAHRVYKRYLDMSPAEQLNLVATDTGEAS
jgi:GT2 family glycosyltransferase